MNIKLDQFNARRDILFDEFWNQFMEQFSKNQRYHWKGRKPYIEKLFKAAWNNGAQTIIDLLNEAMENRSQLVIAQTVPKFAKGVSER